MTDNLVERLRLMSFVVCIEAADRIEALEHVIETTAKSHQEGYEQWKAAEAENAKLREALNYYRETFCEGFCLGLPARHQGAWVDKDCSGCVARAALQGKGE